MVTVATTRHTKAFQHHAYSFLAEIREHPGCCETSSHQCQDQTETVPQDLILALLHSCFQGIGFPAARQIRV